MRVILNSVKYTNKRVAHKITYKDTWIQLLVKSDKKIKVSIYKYKNNN